VAKVGVTHRTEGNKVENQTRSKGLDVFTFFLKYGIQVKF
jgi:hypothetical protein